MKKNLIYPIVTIVLFALLWTMPAQAFTVIADHLQSGTTVPNEHHSYSVGDLWRRSELYFGSNKPDGSTVSEAEFEQFVDEVITPRFPDGLTLLTGYGQFRNSADVIIEEQSFVLILLYPRDDKDANREIEEIRTAYKDQFAQESVLRVDSTDRVSF